MPTVSDKCQNFECPFKEDHGWDNLNSKSVPKLGPSGRPAAGDILIHKRARKSRRFHMCPVCIDRCFPEKKRCATEGCKSFVLGADPNMLPSQQQLCENFCKTCIKQGKAGNPEETEEDKLYRAKRSFARKMKNETTNSVLDSMGDDALCPSCGVYDPYCPHGHYGDWISRDNSWKEIKLPIKTRTPRDECRRIGQKIRRARKRCDEAEIQELRPLYEKAKALVRGAVEEEADKEEAESLSGSLRAFREATREAFKAASVKAEAARAAFKAKFEEATKARL